MRAGDRGVSPVATADYFEKMKVQPPRAELPGIVVAVCAFEVCARRLGAGRDVPASAALVGDEGP